MRLTRYGIEWGKYPGGYQFYFYPIPHWLKKKHRYWGLERIWYDGPHVSIGFWFFNVSWSTQWSRGEP